MYLQKYLSEPRLTNCSEKPLSSRSDSRYYRPLSTRSKYQKLSLKLTLPKILDSLQKNSLKILKNDSPDHPKLLCCRIVQAEEHTCKF